MYVFVLLYPIPEHSKSNQSIFEEQAEHIDISRLAETQAHLLLVEDNLTNQVVVTQQLKPFETADNGVEGIRKWKSGSFDLMLSDGQMPRWKVSR